jgi:circadian clock protein KaiC
MLTRLIDYFKSQQVTTLFTSLTTGGNASEQSEVGVSSLMDTWILLRNLEHGGERNRALYVLKSRGMPHSNQVREFVLSSSGIELVNVYTGGGTVLTGTARLAQEATEAAEQKARQQQAARLRLEMERKRRVTEAQIAVLQASLEAEVDELKQNIEQATLREAALGRSRRDLARQRMGDAKSETRRPLSEKNPKPEI